MLPHRTTIRRIAQAFFLLMMVLSTSPTAAQGNSVVVIPLKGIINPAASSYVERAISEAEQAGASAIVIEMDTPGGLDSSMRAIIQRIIASKVPVIMYVSPPGARAGSAGVYITYAAHVAAMAPSTNIGSATPVAMGESGEQQMSDAMRDKVVNDAVAFARGLAQSRGRNAEWAEKAVREGANITAQEALELNVINLIAEDLPALLEKVDGMEVDSALGKVTIKTAGAPVQRLEMTALESFLHVISDPTIAYILLSLGTLGLIFELSNPGAILPGVVGGICLLFALFGLGTLPINIAGLLLIGFGFALFIADIFAPTHGILTAGGLVSFVLGSVMLINTQNAPFLAISTSAIITVSLAITAFFTFVVGAVVRARRRTPTTGQEGMKGQLGTAKTALDPGGMAYVDGALWKAVSERGTIAEGEPVEVVSLQGLTLVVRPHTPQKPTSR